MDKTSFRHETVFAKELVDSLQLKPNDRAVDCTAGGGGHTALLLAATAPRGIVFAFDRDPQAQEWLSQRFASEIRTGRLQLIPDRFSQIKKYIDQPVAGVCADIGVSSPQLDQSARGFSFMRPGPLDMRMDPSQGDTAADLINSLPEQKLADLIYKYGEEPKSRIIARLIVQERQKQAITRTEELSELIAENIFYKTRSRTHKATKTFQALRIAVNTELEELQQLIEKSFLCLHSGGRLAIITFHSLEDRIVKQKFKLLAGRQPVPYPHTKPDPVATIIKPFPLMASAEQADKNPRARSAKLRCIAKL